MAAADLLIRESQSDQPSLHLIASYPATNDDGKPRNAF